jgi:hypothetical protein
MIRSLLVLAIVAVSAFVLTSSASSAPWQATYRIDHVTDGDTVVLRNGQRVRLVQIDTPEVTSGPSATGRRRPQGRRGFCNLARAFDSCPNPRQIASTTSGDCCATSCVCRTRSTSTSNSFDLEPLRRTSTRADAAATRPAWKHSRSERGRSSSACGERAHTRDTTRTTVSRLAARRVWRGSSQHREPKNETDREADRHGDDEDVD